MYRTIKFFISGALGHSNSINCIKSKEDGENFVGSNESRLRKTIHFLFIFSDQFAVLSPRFRLLVQKALPFKGMHQI